MAKVGEPFPDLDLVTDRGPLRDLLGRKPLVLAFYRGSWCPVCAGHLRSLRERYGELGERAEVVAVAVESPGPWLGLARKLGLPFAVAADPGGEAARRLGIPLAAPDSFWGRLDRRFHPREAAGAYVQPAVLVVDRKGVVRFRYAGRGPLGRPSARKILQVLGKLERDG